MTWEQLGLFSQPGRPYTVSEITARIQHLFAQEPSFRDLWIEGEVSNFTRAPSGHIYFTLKDIGAQLNCVIWRSAAQHIPHLPNSGDQIIAHGRIGLYEQGGRYQLYVDTLRPAGRGSLHAQFERLKVRLTAEGLFDAARKRPLPSFPRRIGIVTSPVAAALRDVLHILRRRYPLAEVLLAPTLVQGDEAPPQIVAALAALNARDDIDVILLVRGGGSLEDLWAFNDERVARAVAASRIPVVSGVGHETDFTLSDFAADVRAPTPSAAAEIATPNAADLRDTIRQHRLRLDRAMAEQILRRRQQLETLQQALHYLLPDIHLANARQQVDGLLHRAEKTVTHRLTLTTQHLHTLTAHLNALDPHTVLRRGYTIVRHQQTGEALTSVHQAAPGTTVTIRWWDGTATAHLGENVTPPQKNNQTTPRSSPSWEKLAP